MKYTSSAIVEGLILGNYRSIPAFCETSGISADVVAAIIKDGAGEAKAADLFALCRALRIDAEELIADRLRFCSFEERQQAWAEYQQKKNGSTTL